MPEVLLHRDVERQVESLPGDIEKRVKSKLREAGDNPNRNLK